MICYCMSDFAGMRKMDSMTMVSIAGMRKMDSMTMMSIVGMGTKDYLKCSFVQRPSRVLNQDQNGVGDRHNSFLLITLD